MPVDPRDVTVVFSPGQSGAAVYVDGVIDRARDSDEIMEHVLELVGVELIFEKLLHPEGKYKWPDVYPTLAELTAANEDPKS